MSVAPTPSAQRCWLAWGSLFGFVVAGLDVLLRYWQVRERLMPHDWTMGAVFLTGAFAAVPIALGTLLGWLFYQVFGRRILHVERERFAKGAAIAVALGAIVAVSLAPFTLNLTRTVYLLLLGSSAPLYFLGRRVFLHAGDRCVGFIAATPVWFGGFFWCALLLTWPTGGLGDPPIDRTLAAETSTEGARDVLLVTLDTTRADRLGLYGYARARTPHIDALGQSGMVFEQATAPMPITQPSHTSILTGRAVPYHGIEDNGKRRLSGRIRTIAADFADAGYYTAATVASYVLDRRYGLDQGFAWYDDQTPGTGYLKYVHKRFLETMFARSLGSVLCQAFGLELRGSSLAAAAPVRSATEATDAALLALERTPADKPLFLWVHYWDPHGPYDPPEEFLPVYPTELNPPEQPFKYWWGSIETQALVDAGYDGEIAYLDSEIERLFRAFRARGRRPIIALTADHGESLHEHNEPTHGRYAFQSSLHVPLVLAGEGIPAGQRSSIPVASYDVAASLLELAGIAIDRPIEAVSLLAQVNGQADPRPITAMSSSSGTRIAQQFAWREGDWKLLMLKDRDATSDLLFNLAADPSERNNLSAEQVDRRERMRQALTAYRASLPTQSVADMLATDGFSEEQLEALGYVDGN